MKYKLSTLKYKLSTLKYQVEGEYNSEEEAIKDLSDQYMQASRFDPPGEHPMELIMGTNIRKAEGLAKSVYFYIEEVAYGYAQWILKYRLSIHPFKSNHWYDSIKDPSLKMPETEFKYSILY